MDIDTRLAMSLFRYNTWNQRHTQYEQLVGDAVIGDSPDGWIAGNDLAVVVGSRISVEHCFHISSEYSPQFRQRRHKLHSQLGSFLLLAIRTTAVLIRFIEAKACQDLTLQQVEGFLCMNANVINDVTAIHCRVAEVARKQQCPEFLYQSMDCFRRWQRTVIGMSVEQALVRLAF